MITKSIPQTIVCVTEDVTQSKAIPQEIFWCNRLAIARLNYTQEHPLDYTNEFAGKYFCVYVMDYISQINSAENNFVYVIILVLPVVRQAATDVISFRVLQKRILPESLTCNSGGPCSIHVILAGHAQDTKNDIFQKLIRSKDRSANKM